MKKNEKYTEARFSKMILSACFIFVFLFSGGVQAMNDLSAQTVTASFKNVTLNDVIWELQKQTDFTFIYSTNDVQKVKVKDVSAVKAQVTDILDECLKNSGLSYTIHNGVIAIKKSPVAAVETATPQQQKVTVSGQVVDNMGDPMPGVNILVKETRNGAITDIDGNFTVEVQEGQRNTLQFSFIGFTTKEVAATPGRTMRVVMEDDTNVLDEVVVTGYGTFKKSAFAGSASTIRMQDKEDVPANDFKTLLQGSAPGVQVNSNSGAIGGSSSVTIRGLGSFNASTSPLYVIDGVPVMTSVTSSIDGGTDIMSTINPADIENITVIKDAAAASLYGSRAANGVILITTKSGKEGKPVFNLKADWGYNGYATDYIPVMKGPERREFLRQGLYNKAIYTQNLSGAAADEYVEKNIDKYAPIPKSGYYDWEDALFREHAPYENYDFSASGGDRKTSYYTSLSYTDQKGIIRQQNYSRITGRMNVKYQMTDKLQLGANILYSKMTQNGSSEGGTYTSPIYSTRHKVSESDPAFNEDGTYNEALLSNGKRNPKSQLDLNYKRQKVDRSFNTIYANYTFIPGLIFNTTFSFDHTNTNYKSWMDPRSTDGKSDNGSLTVNTYQYDQLVWKNNLSYDTRFATNHHLDVLGGYEVHQYKRKYMSTTRKDFPSVEKPHISNASKTTDASGYDTGWRLLSYLGRINYDYASKYYLGVSARVDGSSRLYKDSRWGTFWSVSGAWRISSEPFMDAVSNVLTDARIRASYGSNGTLPSDYYGYMDLVKFGYNYNGLPGMYESQLGNKDLKWEKNYNLNIGLDFTLFNRVNTTIEVYQRKTSDLLMDLPLSQTTGFTQRLNNIGEVQNRGIEVDINADIIRNSDFSWNAGLNFGHNQNKIVNLGDQEQIVGTYYIHKVGQPYHKYYVKEFAGINPDNGMPLFYVNGENGLDQNGNKIVTENEKDANYILYKSPDPKLSGGFTNSFRYKWFDLAFTWTFSLGGYSYDRGASKLEHSGTEPKGAIQTLYRNSWKKPGDKTNIEVFIVDNPLCDMSTVHNSRRVHSTDHLRLKNITFGASLPKEWVRKAYLENVRLYCSAVNLLTFAAYDRYDPEIPTKGDIYFIAPKMKTVTFGIDIKF